MSRCLSSLRNPWRPQAARSAFVHNPKLDRMLLELCQAAAPPNQLSRSRITEAASEKRIRESIQRLSRDASLSLSLFKLFPAHALAPSTIDPVLQAALSSQAAPKPAFLRLYLHHWADGRLPVPNAVTLQALAAKLQVGQEVLQAAFAQLRQAPNGQHQHFASRIARLLTGHLPSTFDSAEGARWLELAHVLRAPLPSRARKTLLDAWLAEGTVSAAAMARTLAPMVLLPVQLVQTALERLHAGYSTRQGSSADMEAFQLSADLLQCELDALFAADPQSSQDLHLKLVSEYQAHNQPLQVLSLLPTLAHLALRLSTGPLPPIQWCIEALRQDTMYTGKAEWYFRQLFTYLASKDFASLLASTIKGPEPYAEAKRRADGIAQEVHRTLKNTQRWKPRAKAYETWSDIALAGELYVTASRLTGRLRARRGSLTVGSKRMDATLAGMFERAEYRLCLELAHAWQGERSATFWQLCIRAAAKLDAETPNVEQDQLAGVVRDMSARDATPGVLATLATSLTHEASALLAVFELAEHRRLRGAALRPLLDALLLMLAQTPQTDFATRGLQLRSVVDGISRLDSPDYYHRLALVAGITSDPQEASRVAAKAIGKHGVDTTMQATVIRCVSTCVRHERPDLALDFLLLRSTPRALVSARVALRVVVSSIKHVAAFDGAGGVARALDLLRRCQQPTAVLRRAAVVYRLLRVACKDPAEAMDRLDQLATKWRGLVNPKLVDRCAQGLGNQEARFTEPLQRWRRVH